MIRHTEKSIIAESSDANILVYAEAELSLLLRSLSCGVESDGGRENVLLI